MTDESIFICDTPPQPLRILSCATPLTPEQIKRFCALWEEHGHSATGWIMVLEPEVKFQSVPGHYEWPDAEFCAA
jgi:hypothetical protein